MKKCILSVLLFFASTVSHSDAIQSPEVLTNKVEQYIHSELASYNEGKVRVTADKIDSRLNLKACAEDQLVVFNPYQSPILNTNTMGIKCQENDNRWSLYVPVRITVSKTIYVAKRTLVKGTRLSRDDIYQTEMDVQRLSNGYFTEKDLLIGQVCKKNIPANSPFNPHNIEAAKLINKGERVSIVVNDNNLTVSMEGVAIEEGSLGETIKVRNLSSKKIIEAQIAGIKKVNVII
ncbi:MULTISPECIES: flagellar basal body P-ring formation chaperone FlgA [Legionella]|uniref:Flagella basal body P-ring formation protein FlgA n=1 Tax=Legionella steelei TaxID=947033 RepID=A0A0W0ZMS7_9GAMM|nr:MULTISPECIES: flagellar basal body P-ring formation chaperone FlgA [Legionella]KTD70439.1 flagellar basal body P-ring biosynthesis protein FlgA [Legionella steelei]MBN9226955.1 flagellar basal body P-ring formation protein FlgA [Legionella steelei]OJW14166.1 MAG: flagella basal body P-ring formation protein FlgA [Legionella sp. 39-23]